MFPHVVTSKFRKKLKAVLLDVKADFERREKAFERDERRIKEELLAAIDCHPPRPKIDDFYIAAVDGSGHPRVATFDDIRVHIVTRAISLLRTSPDGDAPFQEVGPQARDAGLLTEQPESDFFWHSGVGRDALEKLKETILEFYPIDDTEKIVLPYFKDLLGVSSLDELADHSPEYQIPNSVRESLISDDMILSERTLHEQVMRVYEYAAARQLVENEEMRPRYLFLDGSLTLFLRRSRSYPSYPSGFVLRELVSSARKRGVIIGAVSKDHTIPFAHRIATMATEVFPRGTKWFCRLPSDDDPGHGLEIYKDRIYIPPTLAVTYLFCFSPDNRPSRIDFDRIWWLENIFVNGDPETTRANEITLFRDIELMSRDARWYGYPVPLALAHNECTLTRDNLRAIRHEARALLREIELDFTEVNPLREDYNL